MDAQVLRLLERYRNDFPLWCESLIKIVDKEGNLVPFVLNEQQLKLYSIIEKQYLTKGKVRIIVLKSRKLGISTLTAALFLHYLMFNPHKRALVMTHLADSSSALYRIYTRMVENIPPMFKPLLKTSNSKELIFDGIDSSLKIATAGSADVGRGDTCHAMHCSEQAFWPNSYEVAAGALQSVANAKGTFIIVESTPNGITNLFYDIWMNNIDDPDADYQCVYFPWTVDPTCALPLSESFELDDDEKELKQLFQLSNEQLHWRRKKIKEIGREKFQQEFSITAHEAFRNTTELSFIPSEIVLKARKHEIYGVNHSPLVLGVDPARFGDDRSVIVWRKGREIYKYKTYTKKSNDELAEIIAAIIRTEKPVKVYVDATGIGAGVCDCLKMLGYETVEIHFSSKSYDPKYANKRAEIYGRLKQWLEDGNVSMIDEDIIEQELCSIGYKFRNEQILLQSKDEIKKEIKKSPDIADAIALTFSEELGPSLTTHNTQWTAFVNREPDYAW